MPGTRPPMAMELKTALSVKRTERLSFGIGSYRKDTHAPALAATPMPAVVGVRRQSRFAPHGCAARTPCHLRPKRAYLPDIVSPLQGVMRDLRDSEYSPAGR